jgi:hypothetical protein
LLNLPHGLDVGDLTAFLDTYNALKGYRFAVIAIGDAARGCDLIETGAR